MGLANIFSKRKDVEERSFFDFDGSLLAITSMLGGSTITEDKLKKIPTAKTSLELITGSISQLPIYLYKENEDGDIAKVPSDNRIKLLNSEANEFCDSVQYKRKLVEDYLLYGKALSLVKRNGNIVTELHAMNAKNVQFKSFTEDRVTLSDIQVVYSGMGEAIKIPYEDILLIDSGSSGVLKNGEALLQLALDEIEFSSNILSNGALPTGVIETTTKLSEVAIKRLRAGWESLYKGGRNAGKTVILEEGLQYKPVSFNPDQLQLTDSKKVTASEVAKLFNLPESMINSNLTKYNSNAAENLHFLQYTLTPIITAIESALDKALLLESEKDNGYFFRFDTKEILRGTPKEQVEKVALELEKGLITMNEARSELDRNKLETTDFRLLSLGHVLMDVKTGKLTILNMGVEGGKENEDGTQV
ncbi:phage portal protein [Paenibacillus sp. ATY16]|uniref:phage portal protein n=1 Tax=Paenibacillus sp. ATY16 TaxID=1759312 RepID=UPI0020100A35|nr:phage portal protein [Paenibacillus sp. ATY16]MCK9858196.1 phage portal protein [Paenibacillus sp. ATY16]